MKTGLRWMMLTPSTREVAYASLCPALGDAFRQKSGTGVSRPGGLLPSCPSLGQNHCIAGASLIVHPVIKVFKMKARVRKRLGWGLD